MTLPLFPSQHTPHRRKWDIVILRFLILATAGSLSIFYGTTHPWQFWFIAGIYLLSNLIYASETVEHFLSQRIAGGIFLFDVVLVTFLFYTTRVASGEFWLAYFLTILLAALGSSLWVALAAALASACVYGLLLIRAAPDSATSVLGSQYLVRCVFFVLTALFVHSLAAGTRREVSRMSGVEAALDFSMRLAELTDLKRMLDLARDARSLARHILDVSQEVFHGDSGSLMLVDAATGALQIVVGRGRALENRPADPGGIAAYVARTGEPLLLVGPPGRDPRFAHLSARPDISSSISVPLHFGGRTFGVLTFNRSRARTLAFTRTDLQKAQAFAAHVAVALANREFFAELEASRREDEAQLKRLRETQEKLIRTEKLTAVNEVMASMAREINNPLTGILGSVELLRERTAPGGGLRLALDAINRDAQRCQRVVERLLAFRGAQKPNRVPTDLSALVARVMADVDDALKRSGVAMVQRLEQGLPEVLCDREQIERVLFHIVDNARAAMEARTDTIRRLTVETCRVGDTLEISVADTGGGIPLENVRMVFQPFFSTRGGADAPGLGLAAAQTILRDHGGSIRAITDGSQGTTVVLTFQVPETAPPVPDRREFTQVRGEPLPRVLLVDPDVASRYVATRALENHFEVEVAPTATEGMDALRDSGPFVAIIVELNLPDRSGSELFQELANEFPAYRSRVLFLSAQPVTEEQSRVIEESSRPFLRKPLRVQDLRQITGSLARSPVPPPPPPPPAEPPPPPPPPGPA